MKTTASRASAVSQTRGFGDLLYDKAGSRPSLDLDFAGTSSLRDKITGEYLVDHTRASNATYIDNEGLVKEAPFNYHNSIRFMNVGSNDKDSIANPFNVVEDIYYMDTANNHRSTGTGSTGSGGNSLTQMWAASVYMRTDQGTAEVEIDVNDKNKNVVTVTDQWQRFSAVQTTASNNNTYRFFDIQTSDNGTGSFGAVNKGFGPTFGGTQTTTKIYVWGAQLEKNEVTAYMGQNDGAPRFTHERVETGNLLTDSTLKNPNHIKPHIRILQYQALAPDGTFSAAEMRCISSATNYMFANPTTSHIGIKDNTAYTVSIFAKKANTLDTFSIFLSEGGNKGAIFNLTNKTATVYGGGQNTARITETDNGWFRCEVTNSGNPTTVTSQIRLGLLSTTFVQQAVTAGQSFYFWGFQFEEGEAASTVAPSIDTFTSRASSATYVDSAGLVKTAKKNFLTYSEDISQWIEREYGGGQITVTNTTHINPTGEAGSYKCNITGGPTSTSVTGGQVWIQANATTGGQSNMTASVYIKAETSSDVGKELTYWANDSDGSKNWDKVTLTADWQRVTFDNSTGFVSSVGEPLNLGVNNAGPSTAKTATNTVGFYIWGAQFETGLTATDYVKTTASASGPARYSHDPETLTPTGLYLEPAATNVISQNTTLSTWPKTRVNLAIDNNITNPDGSTGAAKISTDASPATTKYIQAPNRTPASGTVISFSGYFKYANHQYLDIYGAYNHFMNSAERIRLDLINGTVTTSSSYTATLTSLPNGWFYLRAHGPKPNTGSSSSPMYLWFIEDANSSQTSVTSHTLKEVYVWGLQTEQSSYPSSTIINNTNGDKTRAADVYTSTANLTETFEPRGLLIEEARTNLLHYSSNPVNNWNSKGGSTTVTANYATAPDGTNTAVRIQMPATSGTFFKQFTSGFSSGTVYTASFWGKSNGQPKIDLIGGPGGTATDFTLSDRWERYTLTWTSSGTAANFGFDNGTNPFSVDALVWGMQVEAGSFATSYIPTNATSAVTRSADVASISGDNFGTYRTNSRSSRPSSTSQYSSIRREFNSALGFDGTKFSATKLIGTSNGQMRYHYEGTNYTYSAYWKLGTPELKFIHFRGGGAAGNSSVCVNLETLEKTRGYYDGNVSNNYYPANTKVEDAGNGWVRISMSFNGTNSLWIAPARSATHTGSGRQVNDFIYLDGEQVEGQVSTPTNVIENPPTFTSRLGNATYVDSNGLIKTAYRNYIHETDWTVDGTVNTWVMSNMTISTVNEINPFDLAEHVANVSGSQSGLAYQQVALTNTSNTLSVYAKANDSHQFNLISQAVDSNNKSQAATFNLTTGTVTDTFNGGTGSIENVGNGWFRCVLHTTHDTNFLLLNPHNRPEGNAAYSNLGRSSQAGTTSMYFYGPQVVDNGSEAGEFYPNLTATQSGAPRYSHDPETLVPTGLYLEPAATNFIPRSNSFHYSNKWVPTGGSIALDNSVAAPTGETGKVAVFTEDTSTGAHNINSSSATSGDLIQTNNSSSYSLFVKPLSTRNIVLLRVNGIGTNTINLAVKLDDQTIHYKEGESGTSSRNITWTVNAHVEKYQNNWYRVVFNYLVNTTNATAGHNPKLSTNFGESNDITNVPNPYEGNGQKIMALFGLQNEVSSYASSYIETDGSAVTRPADTYTSTATTVLDRDGGNKEAFFTPISANSFYVKGTSNLTSSAYPRIFSTGVGNTENWHVYFNHPAAGKLTSHFAIQNGNGGMTSTNAIADGDKYIGAAYVDSGSSNIALNGTLGSAINMDLLNFPTDSRIPTAMHIGNRYSGSREYDGTLNRLTFWKSRLPDASLINITNT